MIKLRLSILLALFIFEGNLALAEVPKPGEMAPPLKLTGILQTSGKLEQTLHSLQGKVVVLEFWATWCAPCIAAMPHLNDLTEKYKNKGVQFISITDESTEKANQFLKNRKINGWVGIDGDNAMFKAYEVQSIPFTVLIGSNGKVLGYPKSKDLSEEMLNQALLGKELVEPPPMPISTDPRPSLAEAEKPLYELSIRPSASQGMSSRIGLDIFKTKGTTALELIKIVFDAKLKHAEVSAQLPEGKFDVVATNSGKDAPDWEWKVQLKRALQDIWKLDVRQERKEVEVYEMLAMGTADKRLLKAEPGNAQSRQSSDVGVLIGRNTSIPVLAMILQDFFSVPVVNMTNLEGNYDYNLYYDDSKPETLMISLEKEMGFRLRKVRRTIEVLIIAPRN
ncbi:MAG: TIGR03435 family protein [Bacteroidota bacterium]